MAYQNFLEQKNQFSHQKDMKKRLAVFASGAGSNAENLIRFFARHSDAEIVLIVSNKSDAGVLQHADKLNVPSIVFKKTDFENRDIILPCLQQHRIDIIILAGFLLRVPDFLIEVYPHAIINIHPALLPKFGGKGMYGMHVHRAVKEAGEIQSGITIHYVDEAYDEGDIIAQYTCPVTSEDSPETIAEKVHQLEYQYFPLTIERLLYSLQETNRS